MAKDNVKSMYVKGEKYLYGRGGIAQKTICDWKTFQDNGISISPRLDAHRKLTESLRGMTYIHLDIYVLKDFLIIQIKSFRVYKDQKYVCINFEHFNWPFTYPNLSQSYYARVQLQAHHSMTILKISFGKGMSICKEVNPYASLFSHPLRIDKFY